jgi:hypothetical protein
MVDLVASSATWSSSTSTRDALAKFYAYVKRKSEGWDGRDPVRRLG